MTFSVRQMLPQVALLAATLAAAAVIGLHALVLGPALVLPALSGMLMTTALCVAGLALIIRAERRSQRITCWDVSGALYFIGCWAAALSETEGVLALMEEIRIRK